MLLGVFDEMDRRDIVQQILHEDDEEECQMTPNLVALLIAYEVSGWYRESPFSRDRVHWENHVQLLLREVRGGQPEFNHYYRMTITSFMKLLSFIEPKLEVDNKKSFCRTGKAPISPKIVLHCCLRWLAGGLYGDVRMLAGISIKSFYRVLHKCVMAILTAPELAFSFPKNEIEIETASEGFQSVSSHGVIDGCVGVLDGLLVRIQTPSSTETGNVKSYFSGHYQDYGINVQAACDHLCRFISVTVSAPGGANDITAFRKTLLSEKVKKFPIGRYIIGDNAYVCTENLLTPFSGKDKQDATKDAYNFYVSQLRIRIEMAFGRMTGKWRVLKKPLQVRLRNVSKVILCIARLHNFCINEKLQGQTCMVEDVVEEENAGFLPSDVTVTSIEGNSIMRDFLVQRVKDLCLSRPNRVTKKRRNN